MKRHSTRYTYKQVEIIYTCDCGYYNVGKYKDTNRKIKVVICSECKKKYKIELRK